MRSKADLEKINADEGTIYGYVDIAHYNCPPFVMFTNHNDCGICGTVRQGWVYEPESFHLWSNLVPLATSVFDIGTRTGEYTLVAASLREDIPIIACEPNPDGYARLVVNILANQAMNVIPKRVAISDQNAYSPLRWVPKRLGQISSGGSLVGHDVPTATTVVVETMRLDTLTADMALGSRPVIKIDVEGAEELVFRGMGPVLEKRPDILLETFTRQACGYINEVTRPLGYHYYLIDETARTVTEREKLLPAAMEGDARNQLLTTRSAAEVASLSSRGA